MTDDDLRLPLPDSPPRDLDLSRVERRVGRRRSNRRLRVGAFSVLVVVAGAVVASRSDDQVDTGPAGAVAVPSPLFDNVEQLTPAELPDGWARCGGGPSERPEATGAWWAQTFGPVVNDVCEPLITVTQVPPDELVDLPDQTEDGKIGGEADGPDAIRWSDADAGSLGLYTWARGQGLMLEACCGPDAAEYFDELAVAALAGTRERTLARCPRPESDLDREDDVDNLFGSQGRMYDRDECPLRRDIATMMTNPADHHCWPDATSLTVGTPVGASYDDTERRVYRRDVEGVFSQHVPDPRLDLDAELPPGAVDTGYHKDELTLWLDEADSEMAYLVADDHVEAWPRDREQHSCA